MSRSKNTGNIVSCNFNIWEDLSHGWTHLISIYAEKDLRLLLHQHSAFYWLCTGERLYRSFLHWEARFPLAVLFFISKHLTGWEHIYDMYVMGFNDICCTLDVIPCRTNNGWNSSAILNTLLLFLSLPIKYASMNTTLSLIRKLVSLLAASLERPVSMQKVQL